MAIEYAGEPEFARRQPAAKTLTEAEAAELNERQAMLLPEVNLGSITGTLSIRARLAGFQGGVEGVQRFAATIGDGKLLRRQAG